MAVRPGPKIFGEIKTIWEPWLLSFRGSWRGAVQAWLTGLQEAGRRVPGAACSLVVIRAVCEGRVRAHAYRPHPWCTSVNKILEGEKRGKETPSSQRSPPIRLSCPRTSVSLDPRWFCCLEFFISRISQCVAVGLPGQTGA